MSQRKRERTPTEKELELWSHVTKNDQPLAMRSPRRMKPSVKESEVSAANGASPPHSLRAAAELGPAAIKAKPAPENGVFSHNVASTEKVNKGPVAGKARQSLGPEPFDSRLSRRLARGQTEIDARLDLHGMRQADAHNALHRFLFRCQEAGHRNVLVITGKGRTGSSDNGGYDSRSDVAGVLRRSVPLWLREPGLSPIVVSFKPSSQNHGGSGALYVALRRPSRVKGV